MPLWPVNALDLFTGPNAEEDRTFFKSMLTDRTVSYGSKDLKTHKLMKEKFQKKQKRDQYLKSLKEDCLDARKTVRTLVSNGGDQKSPSSSRQDPDFFGPSSTKSHKRDEDDFYSLILKKILF